MPDRRSDALILFSLKELEDHNFFPSVLRNYQTDFIGFLVARLNVYGNFISYLRSLALPRIPMVDLCSGSGEPAISIFQKCNCFTHLTLTDKFPNPTHVITNTITYDKGRTDVLEMQFEKDTCYTMFNAFHHFSDQEKMAIVQKIKAVAGTAFFVEILEPTFICLLKVLASSTAGTLLVTPFIKPFSVKRLLLTYVVPVNVFTIAFDGVVSVFRSHSLKKYREMLSGFGNSVEVLRINSMLSPLVIIRIRG